MSVAPETRQEIEGILTRLRPKTGADGHVMLAFNKDNAGQWTLVASFAVGMVPTIPVTCAAICELGILEAYEHGYQTGRADEKEGVR